MTAVATATRVLEWAAEPKGVPPSGPLWETGRLAQPPTPVSDAATQLARRTAALLGAGAPPFGSDPRSPSPGARNRIGLGVIFLAAAVGGRQQAGPAALLAGLVPPAAPQRDPDAWYDLIARHGLVSAAVTALDGPASAGAPAREPAQSASGGPDQGDRDSGPDDTQPLPELLLDASPLTAVLYRPSATLKAQATRGALSTAMALLRRPRGDAVLATGLAPWLPSPAVLTWRAELLSRFRHDHPELVLDVYLVARTRFAAEWDQRVAWAGRQLGIGRPDPLAIATLRFWAPLAAYAQASKEPLSARRPLLTGHDKALHLVRKHHVNEAGAT